VYASVFAQIMFALHAIGILARRFVQPVNPSAFSDDTRTPKNSQQIFDSCFSCTPSGMGPPPMKISAQERVNMTHESSRLKSPALIFFVIALTVFASETLVMLLLLNVLPPLSSLGAAFADALLLVLLISPALYFFLFRPMVAHIRERGKIEEILHKNEEEQFKVMIRASLDGFWITDAHGHFLEANDAYCQMLGYSREELLGMGVSGVEAIETLEDTARRIGKLLDAGSDCFETRHRRRDGSILDIEVSANYSNLHGGRIYCFLRDITGRKQVERELRDAKVAAEEALQKLKVSTQNLRILSRAIEQSPVVNVITDVDGAIQYVNPRFYELTGYTAAEVIGENPRVLNSGMQTKEFYKTFWATITSGQEWHGEMCNKKKNGELFWEYASISPVRNDEGEITQFLAIKEDITERRCAEEELKLSAQILNSISDTIFLLDLDGNFVYLNEAAWSTRGYTRDEMMGMDLRTLNAPEYNLLLASRMKDVMEKGYGFFESAHRCKDGSIMSVEINARITESGGRRLVLSVIRDITERRRAEEMLRDSESRLKELFEHLSSGVAVYQASADGQNFIISAFNGAAERIDNAKRCDLIGKNVVEVFPGIVEFGLLEVFRRVWRSGMAEHFPVSFYQDGRISGWRDNYVYKLPNGEIVAIYDDVTREKQAEEKMHYLAHYDALTDLPNRTLFTDRLRQALATARRDKAYIALMFLDLDKFKPVNDSFGHDVGDLLLKEVALRVQRCVRESDTVSRIGGDEFIVLLPAIEATQDAMQVAEKILHALCQTFELAEHRIQISASIGIAVYPEHGGDEKLLTKHADIAMYHAKSDGRNNARLYRPDMAEEQ